ncbi:MAG: GNAT family N-acetyltransferase [Sphingomonas sp.]|nr:GNAT family N-acetyltransferase [Sphingomonas sp.]
MRELQQPASDPVDPAVHNGPVVETMRLILRQNRPSDLDDRIAITSDPDFMRFVGGVYDRQENWSRIMRYIGHWVCFGFGLFAVEEKGTGRYVGNVGLARFERGLGADFDSYPECGWMVAQWAEGRGYATEAMSAALAWYERHFGSGRQVCMIDPTNTASLRLAEKLGFRPYREGLIRGDVVLLHERNAPPIAR